MLEVGYSLLALASLTTCLVVGKTMLSLIAPNIQFDSGVFFFSGLGILAIVGNILLVFGLFYPLALWIFGLVFWAFIIISHWKGMWRADLAQIFRCAANLGVTGWCLVLSSTLFILVTFAPITGGDSLYYHFPFASDFLASHTLHDPIAGITHIGLGYNPALGEVMFALISGMSLAPSFTIPILLLNACIVLALMRALYSNTEFIIRRPSIRFIVLLLLFIPPVIRDSFITQIGYVDLLCAAYLTIGTIIFIRGVRENQPPVIFAGALLLGVALAIKYLAVIAVSYCFMVAISYAISKSQSHLRKSLSIATLILVISAGYWYGKNLYLHGNPFYPMFSGLGPQGEIGANNYLPQTWWAHLLYPLLVYAPFLFRAVYAKLAIVEFALTLSAFVGAVVLLVRNETRFWVSMLLGYCFWYSWNVSIISDDQRYNIPALIMWVVLFGVVFNWLLAQFSARAVFWVERAFVAGYVLLLPLMVLVYKDRVGFLVGKLSADEFIEAQKFDMSLEQYHQILDIN